MTDVRAFRGYRFPAEVILWAVRWYLQFPIHPNGLIRDATLTCHGMLVAVSGAAMARTSGRAPVHAGAARYYREHGWLP